MPALVGSRRILLPQREYYQRVLRVRPDKLVGYWPMWESGGTIAYDLSPQANNGAYTGVDLGYGGIGDHRRAPFFDGTNDFNNIYSAALATDFSALEGTVMIWARVLAATWTDGITRRLLHIGDEVANDDRIWFDKTAGGRTRAIWQRNGVAKSTTIDTTTTDWYCVVLTYSNAANQIKGFFNGAQMGTTQTHTGAWGSALNSTRVVLGAQDTALATPWSGWLAHCAVWNVALTDDEVKALAIR